MSDLASTRSGDTVAPEAPPPPRVTRREDYAAPDWQVPAIGLDFALGLEETRVSARLEVRRPGDHARPLRLEGDGLVPDWVRVDGAAVNDWRLEDGALLIDLPGPVHVVETGVTVRPAGNTQLMGLYASNGMLCTQCEAEGFRRITFFPDRPDVLSRYDVRMEGDRAQFPVLLSNGDLVEEGEAGEGRHFARWRDPFPKPSYLFALVAGDLVANRDRFVTMSGRDVDLAIWVREGDLDRTGHAMESLKRAMEWDERVYGREYDLDMFNIVAVSDFNMGAMENKGLNIFNTRYILADPETATDADYDAIEGVVAHEYFHNWSGNRVTCRDWFQLSLKEGFTVLRDQQFSADMGSPAVKRIEDVRMLRAGQFPEDSGPLAHPIRPDSYIEISNFYTATVYNKGAEVIRMMATLAGPERFRAGTDLYFDRHDGEAATCEDFVRAMEDGAGLDLGRFRRWYEQAGTPQVGVGATHDPVTGRYTLHLTQVVPPTPGQPAKLPMPVPLRTALFDRATGRRGEERLLLLDDAEASFDFDGHAEMPVLSINRAFSAPVALQGAVPPEDLVFLAKHDDDPFSRYEAMQRLVTDILLARIGGTAADLAPLGEAVAAILADPGLDDSMRAELLGLPTESVLAEQLAVADPAAIHNEREALKHWIGSRFAAEWGAAHDHCCATPDDGAAGARAARKLKGLALMFLVAGGAPGADERAFAQFDGATTMTDRQSALLTLCATDSPRRQEALAAFHARFAGNALVIDKWFSMQAGSMHPKAIDHVAALATHPDFTLANPNRVRALYGAFAGNPHAFHDASGRGYAMVADLILELDSRNPQTASRFVAPLGRWRRIEPRRSAMMRAALERIAAAPGLSRDTSEQVGKSLG